MLKPTENIRITVIQPDIVWEDIDSNLKNYSRLVSGIGTTDLIILPEMFSTGFTMNTRECHEKMNGRSVIWMKKVAIEKQASVLGSILIGDNGKYYNRAIWVFPDGTIQYYDKRHLFSMGEEHLHFEKGLEKIIIEYKGWKFCPLICYDLRFPVWSRNFENYDVLIYLANWPAVRNDVWKNLLVARAIENQSYCIGVNRIGGDGNGIIYNGLSTLISPKGSGNFLDNNEQTITYNILFSELQDFREKFTVLKDKDNFSLLI